MQHLALTRAEQVFDLFTRVFPDERLPDRARLLFEDLFDAMGSGGELS